LENSSRGIWALTLKGQITKRVNCDEVKRSVRALDETVKRTREFRAKSDVGMGIEDGEGWKDDLLTLLKRIPPDSFERLCQRLLRESGFVQVEVTGRSGDGGIDGKGVVKIGGLLSFHVVFQCKRFSGSVSPKIVRDFRGAMIGRADKGLLLTTGTFTREAKLEASRDGAPPIDLVDGSDLVEKLKDLRLGIETEHVTTEKVVVNASWFENL
jgi:restriction system protein